MSTYQGKHRTDDVRGRHRTWPAERAVAPLFGASTALTAGALAALFLSGSGVLPDDPGAPPSPAGAGPRPWPRRTTVAGRARRARRRTGRSTWSRC